MTKKKQLTVGELIELLQQQPPDLPVYVEGCDCEGGAYGVRTDNWGNDGEGILITRD